MGTDPNLQPHADDTDLSWYAPDKVVDSAELMALNSG